MLAAAMAATVAVNNAAADEYPDRPVEMTVLFGGSAKTIAQILSDMMAKELGQPVPAISKTGGGGAVGYTYTKDQPADGYSMVWNSNSISTSHHKGNMDFNYTAFDAVARVSLEVPAMAVRADSGWNNLQDFITAAKASPGKMKIGISGKGSFTHLTSAALFDAAGIEVTFVPYGKGRAPAELLGGRIDAALQWPSQFKSHADAGTLKIVAVTSADRIPLLPDVATAKEQGVDVDIVMWRGLAVPAGTPADRIAKLDAAAKAVVESEEFIAHSKKIGFKPAYLSASDFGALIVADDARIAKQMQELGLTKK
jgi:tripartite-type tricarboxylate transporter receptor subunit TctC